MSCTPLPSNSSTIPHPLPSIPLYSPLLSLSLSLSAKDLIKPLINPIPIRRRYKVPRILLNLLHARVQIRFVRLDPFRLLDKLPSKIQDRENENHHVSIPYCQFRLEREGFGVLFFGRAYENRNVGTSQFPLRKTG